jgi:hypothetical protein
MTGIKLTAERLRTLLRFREACVERRGSRFCPGFQPGILLPTSQDFVISLLGNQWVSSLGLPVLDLRRMLLLLLL